MFDGTRSVIAVGSALDTALFFSLAFAGTDVPWVTLALGDFAVKMAMALAALVRIRVGLNYSHGNLVRMIAIYTLAALPFFTGGAGRRAVRVLGASPP